jgi:hypothetical protein
VALLPLSLALLRSEAGHMSSTVSQQPGILRRLANRMVQVVAECNEATRQISTLAVTPDRFPVDPDRAPDTYEQFLIRTAGLARRETERSGRRGDRC